MVAESHPAERRKSVHRSLGSTQRLWRGHVARLTRKTRGVCGEGGIMGVDLRLANRVWKAAQREVAQQASGLQIDYPSVLFAVIAILNDRELAQELVDETWDEKGS